MKGNVWVTGTSGFVGSSLKETLINENFEVTFITNSMRHEDGYCYIDYASKESIRDVIGKYGVPDAFYHLGWGDVYDPELQVHLGQNLINAKNLMDVLYENGLKKFIFIGSSSEYGSREGCLSEEYDPVGRLTKYAQGKIEASRYGFEAAENIGRIFIHVRLFHTLGFNPRKKSLINQLYKSYLDSTPLGLTECDQYRDYIYISDVADGLIKIGDIETSEIVNLGSGVEIQLKDIVKIFWEKLDGPVDHLLFGVHKRPDNEPVQPRSYANMNKMKMLTGWSPAISIDEAVSRTVDAFKAHC